MQRTEYKIKTSVKLDPSISFSGQFREMTKDIPVDDANYFKNVTDSLGNAKKDKLNRVREAQKQLATKKQQGEAAEAAER